MNKIVLNVFRTVFYFVFCGIMAVVESIKYIFTGSSILGKIFIMLFMFMGRVGSLTIFMALASRGVKKNPLIRYPEGKIIVG